LIPTVPVVDAREKVLGQSHSWQNHFIQKKIINEWYFYCSFMQYFSFFLYLNGAERLNTATQQSGVFTDFLFT
jgi:hypothetical protein